MQTGVRHREGQLAEPSGELPEKQKSSSPSDVDQASVTSQTGPRIFLNDFLFNNEDNKNYLTFTICII